MRQSNFELLSIMCMLSIIGIHVYTQTNASRLTIDNGLNYIFIVFIAYGGRLVCNCYVMIGAWFLTESDFKAERVVNLWLEVFFYSVIITVVCRVLGVGDASFIKLVQSFFPVFGRPVWFAAEYICLLLLSPFMNKFLLKDIVSCKKLLIIMGTLIIGCATAFPVEHTTPAFSELTWFCFLYLLIGYLKRCPLQWCNKKKDCWIWAGMSYVSLCLIYIICDTVEAIRGRGMIATYYMEHYESLGGFLCSLLLFYAVKNTLIPYNKGINKFGNCTFAVYVIHQVPAFYPFLWNGIFHVNEWVDTIYFIGYLVMMELIIFIICCIVDSARKCIFEKCIFRSTIYEKICSKIARLVEI